MWCFRWGCDDLDGFALRCCWFLYGAIVCEWNELCMAHCNIGWANVIHAQCVWLCAVCILSLVDFLYVNWRGFQVQKLIGWYQFDFLPDAWWYSRSCVNCKRPIFGDVGFYWIGFSWLVARRVVHTDLIFLGFFRWFILEIAARLGVASMCMTIHFKRGD